MCRTALFATLLLELVVSVGVSACAQSVQQERSAKEYKFTSDWFTSNIPIWQEVLAPFRGRPNIHYLEVGVYEGRSAIWMLENVLTHPTSTLTGIDLFWGDLKQRYLANLRVSGYENKATTIIGRSQIELRRLLPNFYDIIYIDGGHTADNVMADATLCWELLKVGGLLIFDDYRWKEEEYPDELRPQVAIDAFITAYRNYLEIVHRGYQLIVRKKNGPDPLDPSRTILGDYVYVWEKRELRRRSDDQPVKLSDTERDALEKFVRSRPFGKTTFAICPSQARDETLQALLTRLRINYEVSKGSPCKPE